MKQVRTAGIGALFFLIPLCLSASAGSDSGFIRVSPQQVPFKSAAGLEQAVLFGDPSKPGIYVVRVRFPPGVHSNPHFHSQDRHVTVIKGIWWMGVGEQLDLGRAVPMKAGSYVFHPAGAAHWDGAGEQETIVQIVGMGPVETVQIDAHREPIGKWDSPKNPD